MKASRILWRVAILMLFIYMPDLVFFYRGEVYNYLLIGFVILPLMFLLPVVFFSKNLRVYYFVLSVIASVTPVALLPIFLINSQVNAEMIGMVLDTNMSEVKELLGLGLPLLIIMIFVFYYLSKRLTSSLPRKISWGVGFGISGMAAVLFLSIPFFRTTDLTYYSRIIRNAVNTYYPFRMFSAIGLLASELRNVSTYRDAVKDFSFEAEKVESDSSTNIHVLLIGETARYDHWAINGYTRSTSPRLSREKDLVTFSNVSSGASMTVLSVPLIISRADASNYSSHKKERSVLGLFKEAGYGTFWISNQSRFGLSGNIAMHYEDSDSVIFNGWGANEGNFSGNTDSVLIPIVRDVISRNRGEDLFLVVHMIGSHWRYLLRYPPNYSLFSPVSDRNRMMIGYPSKEIMINEYDNSILFTDYVISELIGILRMKNCISTLTYVSDHGENFRDDERNLYFHGYSPTKFTTHVPLFIWTSDYFRIRYPEKVANLRKHRDSAVSTASNLFYTLADFGGIRFNTNDSTKILGSDKFVSDKQVVLGENGKLYLFKDIK